MLWLLWVIVAILVIFWIVGLAAHLLGTIIWVFLVVAVVLFLLSFVFRR
jgi:uncharacterized protein DUF5670